MRKIKLCLILVITVLFSGCWDKVEIDRRVFVSTIGVDVGKDIDKERELKKTKESEIFAEQSIKKLNVTYAFPDISDFSPSKGRLQGDNTFLAQTYSMEGAMSEITAKSSRNVYLEHTRLLMLSRDLIQYPNTLKEVVDYVQRHPKLSRRMYVITTEGPPEEFIKIKPEIDKHIEAYITGLMENSNRNSSILPVTLNEFLKLLSENGNALIPSVKLDRSKKEIILTGVAVIKDYELKGYINSSETGDLEILRGNLKGGAKAIFEEGHPIDYEIDGINRKIKVDKQENKLNFTIKVELEGRLKGTSVDMTVFGGDELTKLEKKFDKSIALECEKLIQYTQKELKVDPIGLREYIKKFHPSIWREVKDNWEASYADANIKVDVKTSIRRIGVAN